MRANSIGLEVLKALILGILCVSGTALAAPADSVVLAASAAAWESSPYHNFSAPQEIWNGRAEVRDEAPDAGLAAELSQRLADLSVQLQDQQGWRAPAAAGDVLKIFIERSGGDGVRRVAARALEGGHLASPSIQLDASELTTDEIVHEVSRLYALATLAAYGVPDRSFLTAAAASYLAGGEDASQREAVALSAAAPAVDLSAHAESLGRLYVEEFVRDAGGQGALRTVWERAAQTGEQPSVALLETFAEATGSKEDDLLLRFGARLYDTVETEPSPARVSLGDLELGALDGATPTAMTLRHRVFVPGQDSAAIAALRVQWPDQAAGAAAIVRYREAALAPDVVFLAPGTSHAIPLSGVARVDFVVAATAYGPPVYGATALVEPISQFPYAGLAAQATASSTGPRISWTTESHQSLAGWAVFREEVLPDGRIARTGPEIVPSSNDADESFRYVYVDSKTNPATFYRYTVWAVTQDGLLARAFSATLRTE